jgi:hypothetical protein
MSQTIAAPVSTGGGTTTIGIAVPFADAGRGVIDRVTGGFQWYLEQWEDRIHEVKAERAHRFERDGVTAETILSGLDEAVVVSDTPGRVRLRVPALRRQDAVAAQTVGILSEMAGVRHVEANPLTASVLVLYDTDRYPSTARLIAAARKRKPKTARRTAASAS